MDCVTVNVLDNNSSVKVEKNTTFLELSKKYNHLFKGKILLANVDNEFKNLINKITKDCTVKFLDLTYSSGYRVYQRSMSFLMIYSAKEVLGKKTRIVVKHSINKNYYCEIPEIELTEEILQKIENKMRETVKKDIPIEKLSTPLEEGIDLFKQFGMDNKADALKYKKSTNISLYKLDWFYDYFYGPMTPSTGYLDVFKLVKQDNGFVMVFASSEDPSKLAQIKILNKLTQVFFETSEWTKILNVDTVGALNNIICSDNIKDIIWTSEALHEKKIAQIADMITKQKKSIILIAGPSSSGKTTFAKRICIQLRVNGLKPYVISLDDYYLNRENAPLDKNGKPDFEVLEALDVKQFNQDMINILNGECVKIPKFNFFKGEREYDGRCIKLSSDEVLIIEGIHGLNEKLTASVPRENKFKIYISALTQLNFDDHNRITTTDVRIIRRIVRDHKFRGFSAASTIDIWPSVLRGEEMNIFPFQEEADVMFNSALVYELSVLKQYAEPLLFQITKEEKEYAEATRLIRFLDSFLTISSEVIPNNSIIREFIGGSYFDE